MSVAPDQMPGLTGSGPASPAESVPQMQSELSQFEGQMAGVSEAQTKTTQRQMQTLEAEKPPTPQTGVFSSAPFLIGLAALGGKATGLHARIMLSASNGMVKGMLMGSRQQYVDSLKTYEENHRKLTDMFALQQKYYDSMYRALGDRADAKLRAIQFARQMTNDEWKHTFEEQKALEKAGMDEMRSWYQQSMIENKRRELEETRVRDAENAWFKQQEADRKQAETQLHRQTLDIQLQKIKQQSDRDISKSLNDNVLNVSRELTALKKKYPDLKAMSPEDAKRYDQLLVEQTYWEKQRGLYTPIPVSTSEESHNLEHGQRYVRPDGSVWTAGDQQPGQFSPRGTTGTF